MSTSDNGVILLNNVRLSFAHLAEPQTNVDETTGAKRVSWNADFIMLPDHPGFKAFMQRYGELALAHAKEHAQAVMAMVNSNRKSRCFGNGDEKVSSKNFKVYDGYGGNVFITASSKTPPQVIQADGRPIDSDNTLGYQQMARKMYDGCRVNVAVKPWWQKPNPAKQYSHGIRCDLIAVQFAGDDTPFGAAPIDATGLFGAVSVPTQAPTPPAFAMPAAPFMGVAPVGTPPAFLGQ